MVRQMARERASKPAKHYRCCVVLNLRFTYEERGFSLGPGSFVSHELYAELTGPKHGIPLDMFEEVVGEHEAEPQTAEESETD